MMKLQGPKPQLPIPSTVPPAGAGAVIMPNPSASPKVLHQQGALNKRVMNMPPKMGLPGKVPGLPGKVPGLPGKVSSAGGSIKSSLPSPSLYRRQTDTKIDALVKATYQEKSNSVKVIELNNLVS